MTHCSFSQGLRSFFSVFATLFRARWTPQAPVRPACPPADAASRTRAPPAPGCTRWPRDGLPARRRVCVALGGRLAGQSSIQPDLDEPLAQPMDGGHPDLERVSDLPVRPVRAIDIGLQQHSCPQRLVPGHARPHHQLLEGVAFLVGQPDDVLGFFAHGSLLPQVPMWSDVSHNGPKLSKQNGYPTRVDVACTLCMVWEDAKMAPAGYASTGAVPLAAQQSPSAG